MKKLFLLTAIFALVFASCENEEVKTTLTIRNESGRTLRSVKWQSYDFTEDKSDGYHILTFYINPGSKVVKDVTEGTGYIYFTLGNYSLRTQELVAVDAGNNSVFTFTENTVVVERTNPGNIGPLSEF